tara:strand:+ start:1508 stop:2500 length:993 start_codon:yes stop_codon:yes gene_type:complete
MHIDFNLSKIILAWYDNNKRPLPWRVQNNHKHAVYFRILSEFMLQQTQVQTVIPYFNRFIDKYPNLKSLSRAKEKDVMKAWEGLGYYRRARFLLASAKKLEKNNFKLPRDFDEIKKLPGVGDYTANVLLALIYNNPTIAFDGNVKRIFSRILNKNENLLNQKKIKSDNQRAFFSHNRNSDFVEALMEFGALICKPKPLCENCPIKKDCLFKNSKTVSITKAKIKKTTKKLDIFCYVTKRKQIGLTKKNNLGFLKDFLIPKIKIREKNNKKNWSLLKNYSNSISNKKLDINLYYKFSKTIPKNFEWHSIGSNKEVIPSFTKKIINHIEELY